MYHHDVYLKKGYSPQCIFNSPSFSIQFKNLFSAGLPCYAPGLPSGSSAAARKTWDGKWVAYTHRAAFHTGREKRPATLQSLKFSCIFSETQPVFKEAPFPTGSQEQHFLWAPRHYVLFLQKAQAPGECCLGMTRKDTALCFSFSRIQKCKSNSKVIWRTAQCQQGRAS